MKEITMEYRDRLQNDFDQDPSSLWLQNSLVGHDLKEVGMSHEKQVLGTDMLFPEQVRSAQILAQRQSGRCWLFSALNVVRARVLDAGKVQPDFAFSVPYLYFWDKMEKTNVLFEQVIEEPQVFPHTVYGQSRMRYPIGEGGQWFMFRNLVCKYGVVPQAVMPETYHSQNSQDLNRCLFHIVRTGVVQLKKLAERGASASMLQETKETYLKSVYRLLCCTLGTPPRNFSFEYVDGSGAYQRLEQQTPQQFFREFCQYDIENYVCVTDAPGQNRPYHQVYTLDHFDSMCGGETSRYYNLEMKEIRPMLLRQLADGESIWFGCDCMHMMDRQKGIMMEGLYTYDDMFQVPDRMTKAEMLDYGETGPNHDMVIAAAKRRADGSYGWKVENSWGIEAGQNGFYYMDDAYLDQYAFQFIIHTRYFNEQQKAEWEQLSKNPVVVDYNDPLGM